VLLDCIELLLLILMFHIEAWDSNCPQLATSLRNTRGKAGSRTIYLRFLRTALVGWLGPRIRSIRASRVR
jgi:hypothetical protein